MQKKFLAAKEIVYRPFLQKKTGVSINLKCRKFFPRLQRFFRDLFFYKKPGVSIDSNYIKNLEGWKKILEAVKNEASSSKNYIDWGG